MQSVLRCLMGYFAGIEADKVPFIKEYENTVIELSPHRDGCDIKYFPLDLEEVDVQEKAGTAPKPAVQSPRNINTKECC
jgi:hypothetical protein